jgi:hypothetical protein
MVEKQDNKKEILEAFYVTPCFILINFIKIE